MCGKILENAESDTGAKTRFGYEFALFKYVELGRRKLILSRERTVVPFSAWLGLSDGLYWSAKCDVSVRPLLRSLECYL